MSNASDFIIENGVLKKYVGPGGDVTIPEGVTSIGDGALRSESHCLLFQRSSVGNTTEKKRLNICSAHTNTT